MGMLTLSDPLALALRSVWCAGVAQCDAGGSVPSPEPSLGASVGVVLEDRALAVLFLRWNLRNARRSGLGSPRLHRASVYNEWYIKGHRSEWVGE